MADNDEPLARDLALLVDRAETDRRARAQDQERVRARLALKKALTPLIGFEGPSDPRAWEAEYARLLLEAARSVKVFTGWKTLRALRPPPTPGFAIADGLFRFAFDDWSHAKLAAKVRDVVDPIVRARSVEGRNALRDYYDWMWKHLCAMQPIHTRTPRRSGRIPDIEPEALRAGYQAVLAMKKTERLDSMRIIALYGLGDLDPGMFLKSPRYVQTAGKPLTAWRLPRVPERLHDKRDKTTKQFRSARWWTPREVRTAIEGQAERLRIDLHSPVGPF